MLIVHRSLFSNCLHHNSQEKITLTPNFIQPYLLTGWSQRLQIWTHMVERHGEFTSMVHFIPVEPCFTGLFRVQSSLPSYEFNSSIFWLRHQIFSLQNYAILKSFVFIFIILSVFQSSVFPKTRLPPAAVQGLLCSWIVLSCQNIIFVTANNFVAFTTKLMLGADQKEIHLLTINGVQEASTIFLNLKITRFSRYMYTHIEHK